MALPQEQAPFRVIPLDEFLQFGQEIHAALDKRQLQGVDEHGTSVRFGLAREMGEISTDPLVTPPYGNVMDLRTFVAGIGVGIAMRRKQELSPTFDLEVNVAVPAVLLPRAEEKAKSKMDKAVQTIKIGRVFRASNNDLDQLRVDGGRVMIDSISASTEEAKRRDIRFNVDIQYTHYVTAAEYFVENGSFEGFRDYDSLNHVEQDRLLFYGGREE